jgi:hypothetical protein
MLEKIATYRKAIAALLVAPLAVLGGALTDGTVTGPEWVAIALAALGTGAAVYAVPNAPQEAAQRASGPAL